MESEAQFIGFRSGSAVFSLRCTCGTHGELTVHDCDRNKLVPCPGECGAQFIQRQGRGFFAVPALELAIAPSKRKPPKSASEGESRPSARGERVTE